MPVFTDIPFGSLDQNGNQIVNGFPLPMPIPIGNNAQSGRGESVFALAIMRGDRGEGDGDQLG